METSAALSSAAALWRRKVDLVLVTVKVMRLRKNYHHEDSRKGA